MQHAQSGLPFAAETMFVLARAVVYATVFVGLLLVFVPAQLLTWAGISRPAAIGAPQIAALIVGGLGAVLTVWCIATFAFIGKGTPAVFDPPRRLVVKGPYRYMRNPMYFGAALAIAGAALYYQSITLLAYASAFLLFFHFFVVLYGTCASARLWRRVRDILPPSWPLGRPHDSPLALSKTKPEVCCDRLSPFRRHTESSS